MIQQSVMQYDETENAASVSFAFYNVQKKASNTMSKKCAVWTLSALRVHRAWSVHLVHDEEASLKCNQFQLVSPVNIQLKCNLS